MTTPDFARAVETIYAAACAPRRWPEALAHAADHLGAEGGLIAFHPRGKRRGFLISGRLREDLGELYLDHYASNPFALALARMPPSQPVFANRLVDMTALKRSAFHADILAPQRIEGQLALVHPSLTVNGAAGGVSFALSPRHMGGLARATQRLRMLTPHITRAIDLSLETGRQMAGERVAANLLERTSVPSMLLDDKGRVIYANRGAERLLAEADGLLVRQADGLRLAAATKAEDRRLCTALRQAVTIAAGRESSCDGALRVTRPSGEPSLLVLVSPLPGASFPFWPAIDRGGCVLVQVPGAQHVTETHGAALEEAFGFTAAEARVARLIGQGHSAPQAAERLGILPTTVKSHLARCFDKAEVRSQASLARLIATIPDRRVRLQE